MEQWVHETKKMEQYKEQHKGYRMHVQILQRYVVLKVLV